MRPHGLTQETMGRSEGAVLRRSLQKNFCQTQTHSLTVMQKTRTKSKDKKSKPRHYFRTNRINPEQLALEYLLNKEISPTLDKSLPKVLTNCKSPHPKKGPLLEIWLDQALSKTKQDVSAGPLSTIRDFQIDRKYLQSQNVSLQTIERLYNSLYVYTQGLSNTFAEIGTIAKTGGQPEHIISSFWKAFIKLMQGCTSYVTVYQIVQKQHLRTITELKDALLRQQAKFAAQKAGLDSEINKLRRRLVDAIALYNQLEGDYKVESATLELTEQSFDQQVHQRLRFEEKLNTLFNSYEEVKQKYDKIYTDFMIKQQVIAEQGITIEQLEARILKATCLIEEQKHLLQSEKEHVRERELQVQILREQTNSMRSNLLNSEVKQTADLEAKDYWQKQLKACKAKLKETEKCLQLSQQQFQQVDSKQREKLIKLEGSKEVNDQLIGQNREIVTKIAELEGEILGLKEQLKTLLKETEQLRVRNNGLSEHNLTLQVQISNLERQLASCREDIEEKKKQILKNSETIGQLRDVNIKFQSLHKLATRDKMAIQVQKNDAIAKLMVAMEEKEGLQINLDSVTRDLTQARKRMKSERELLKSKIAGLNDQIAVKDNQISNYHDKLDEQNSTNAAHKDIELMMQQQAARFHTSQLQKDLKLRQISSLQQTLEKQYRDSQQRLAQMTSELQSIRKEKLHCEDRIASKDQMINAQKADRQKENQALRQFAISRQKIVAEKSQHVHPMLYEDARAELLRHEKRESPKWMSELEKQASLDQLNIFQLLKQLGNSQMALQQAQRSNRQLMQHLYDSETKTKESNKRLQEFTVKSESARMSYESDLQILKIRIENYQQSKEEADRTAAKSSETINSTKQLLSEAQTRISKLEEKIQRADTESKTRQKEDVAVGVDFAIGVGVPVGVQTDFCKLIRSGHSNARRATKQLYSQQSQQITLVEQMNEAEVFGSRQGSIEGDYLKKASQAKRVRSQNVTMPQTEQTQQILPSRVSVSRAFIQPTRPAADKEWKKKEFQHALKMTYMRR